MKRQNSKSIFWNEEGFSTIGMALALLITLSLLFTAARVYEINTASAGIQEVADASALAAENVVGEYYLLAYICDATVFTLSIASICSLGLGIASACTPVTAAFSSTLLKASTDIANSRNDFSKKAVSMLNKVQKCLPFFAAAKALSVMRANNGGTYGDSYTGIALLSPLEAENIKEPNFSKQDDAAKTAEETADEISKDGEKAEEMAKVANRLKEEAYKHDSGSQSDYCMYERADKLAGMSGADNPYYSSSETWSFSVALNRAKLYYQKRYEQESPSGSSVNELSNSALRKKFYAFAVEEVNKGFVYETEDSFSASFPTLPRNTSEMRSTALYTDASYPITQTASGSLRMHAWSGCPQISKETNVGTGSIQQMETQNFSTCPICDFSASSMGKVAAASSSIENGFEYHYNIVANCAEEYQKARQELDEEAKKVKDNVENNFEKIKQALEEALTSRIEVSPPGRYGAVALVANTSSVSSIGHFSSSYVEDAGQLGARAAISSAALVKESSDEGKTVINSFLDGFDEPSSALLGPEKAVLSLWSSLLSAYSDGQESLSNAIKDTINLIPFASESGLGTWASKKFDSLVKNLGFEPPELKAAKAVLVNSSHVLEEDSSRFSAVLLNTKKVATEMNGGTSLFSSALSAVEKTALEKIQDLGDDYELTTIKFLNGAISIPITISLPAFVTETASDVVRNVIDQLQGIIPETSTNSRRWE